MGVRFHTEESKAKMRAAKLGKKASEETRRRMSESQKRIGNRPPSPKGKEVTEETRQRMRESRLGHKSNLWKGGKTELTSLIRENYRYKKWRTDVYERDNYTCIECGQVGGKLNADHIVPFHKLLGEALEENNAVNLEKREQLEIVFNFHKMWNTENGRTLCVSCHGKTSTYGRPKNN